MFENGHRAPARDALPGRSSGREIHLVVLLLALAILAAVATAACAAPATRRWPGFSELPPRPDFPAPLVMFDGKPVTTQAQWNAERRPELKSLFEHYEYGPIPPKSGGLRPTTLGQHADFLGGEATLKLVTLEAAGQSGPRIDLLLVLPNHRPGPAPVFLAMNFCGNHALTSDPRVPLARSWMAKSCAGCPDGTATEAARGSQAADWPLKDIVRRGYALAAFYSGDADADRADASIGVYQWLAQGDPARNNPTNRGTIAAWAWGFQRCVDYLVTEPAVDARRIAAVGHSRNGKTALLAAAFDERIAMAYPHQAGCGGTAPSRSTNGESVKAINDRFPHWFNAEFKQFNAAPERLPFDQHCLLALCAPRPVLVSAALEDQWANPAGQFQMVQAADPVYRLLGVEGLGLPSAGGPPLHQMLGGRLGFYYRAGKHSMTADDWRVFMDFADKQGWKK